MRLVWLSSRSSARPAGKPALRVVAAVSFVPYVPFVAIVRAAERLPLNPGVDAAVVSQ